MVRFEFEFEKRRRIVRGNTPHAAWKAFKGSDPKEDGATLVRFREISWNAQYAWDKAEGKSKKGCWYFVKPSWLNASE